jgi:hypothetical protein
LLCNKNVTSVDEHFTNGPHRKHETNYLTTESGRAYTTSWIRKQLMEKKKCWEDLKTAEELAALFRTMVPVCR